MQLGWTWLDYLKTGQVLAKQEVSSGEDVDWAEVQIDFAVPDSGVSGAYKARIEVCGQVMSALNSAKEMQLKAVKQYRVSQLIKVE